MENPIEISMTVEFLKRIINSLLIIITLIMGSNSYIRDTIFYNSMLHSVRDTITLHYFTMMSSTSWRRQLHVVLPLVLIKVAYYFLAVVILYSEDYQMVTERFNMETVGYSGKMDKH